ncbi:unnamed protein product, partial [Mesorhabditis spiculigera]
MSKYPSTSFDKCDLFDGIHWKDYFDYSSFQQATPPPQTLEEKIEAVDEKIKKILDQVPAEDRYQVNDPDAKIYSKAQLLAFREGVQTSPELPMELRVIPSVDPNIGASLAQEKNWRSIAWNQAEVTELSKEIEGKHAELTRTQNALKESETLEDFFEEDDYSDWIQEWARAMKHDYKNATLLSPPWMSPGINHFPAREQLGQRQMNPDQPGPSSQYGAIDQADVAVISPRQTMRKPVIRIEAPEDVEPVAAQQNDDAPGGDEVEMKYGAEHVIRLFVPVSLCMALVVATMNSIDFYGESNGQALLYTPFTKPTEDTGEKVLYSLGNAAVLLAFIIVMTVALICLYKYRFYRIIHGWLFVSSLLLLTMFVTLYVVQIFKTFNVSASLITVFFGIYNFATLGMICIHWKGPLILQQAYLIIVSALMALTFLKYLPDWTVWTVLGAISIWDLIAVLTPKGPLRILVETAQERNEPIFPALIYSSGILYPYTLLSMVDTDEPAPMEKAKVKRYAVKPAGSAETAVLNDGDVIEEAPIDADAIEQAPEAKDEAATTVVTPPARAVTEERGIKLGLGDFIFYSILVGKASTYYDWNTTLACYVAILIGLCLTLLLLAVYKKALPALPISIFFGLSFYFLNAGILSPFCSRVTENLLVY